MMSTDAAASLAAKLRSFASELTPDERAVLADLLERAEGGADVQGFSFVGGMSLFTPAAIIGAGLGPPPLSSSFTGRKAGGGQQDPLLG